MTQVDKLQLLITKIYARHMAGGNLHIVLDDENVTDKDIEFCLKLPDLTQDERECAEILLAMTESKRLEAIRRYV